MIFRVFFAKFFQAIFENLIYAFNDKILDVPKMID
jgi:hypothetical protein